MNLRNLKYLSKDKSPSAMMPEDFFCKKVYSPRYFFYFDFLYVIISGTKTVTKHINIYIYEKN